MGEDIHDQKLKGRVYWAASQYGFTAGHGSIDRLTLRQRGQEITGSVIFLAGDGVRSSLQLSMAAGSNMLYIGDEAVVLSEELTGDSA